MDAFGEHVGREDQRFALPDGEHGAIVADPFEPVVGQSGEEFFYVVYESEFGCVRPRRPAGRCGFSGFSRAAAAPGAESPPGDGNEACANRGRSVGGV